MYQDVKPVDVGRRSKKAIHLRSRVLGCCGSAYYGSGTMRPRGAGPGDHGEVARFTVTLRFGQEGPQDGEAGKGERQLVPITKGD